MGANKRKLLLADDDESYRHSLHTLLELDNFEVQEARSVKEALQLLTSMKFDIVLADVRMTDHEDDTDVSGLEVAKATQEMKTPCIIITGFENLQVALLTLPTRGGKSWADDMVLKKDGPRAVLDSLRIVLGGRGQSDTGDPQPTGPDLVVDLNKRLVFFKGKQVHLSKYQYPFIAYLYEHEETLVSDRELIKVVYGESLSEQETQKDERLDRLAARIREKIGEESGNPRYLVKEQGRGFMLIPSGQEIHRNNPV